MKLEDFDKLLTQEERDRIDKKVVAEMFPHLPKRRKTDEN